MIGSNFEPTLSAVSCSGICYLETLDGVAEQLFATTTELCCARRSIFTAEEGEFLATVAVDAGAAPVEALMLAV